MWQEEEPLVLAHRGLHQCSHRALTRGSCTDTFSADFGCGMCSRDCFSSSCPCLHCPWRVLAGTRLPGLCCSGTGNSWLIPCGCGCFPCSRSGTWAACSTLCSDVPLPTNPARSPHGHSGSSPSEHQQGTRKCFSQQMSYFSALNVSNWSMKCVGEGQEDDGWSLLR